MDIPAAQTRPSTTNQALRELVVRLARENPRWGYQRIADELIKLGRPGGPHGPKTSWLTDPDGYRIELVQWPHGHPDGITAADFA